MTDLSQHIAHLPLIDTHEHLASEDTYSQSGPDVLQDLFQNYVRDDLISAGASPEAMQRLFDAGDADVAARFRGVEDVWRKCQYTGYGEAVHLIARNAYGMEEITVEGITAAAEQNRRMRQPGQRLIILKEIGRLDHVQIDDFRWACLPDKAGPDFFLYDLSWAGFCNADIPVEALRQETGVEVTGLETLRQAMEALFATYGPVAVAVKAQHAYNRTLRWEPREDADAERVLERVLRGQTLSEGERLCLGDWGWARGVELAIQYNLPFKTHTGHYAGNSRMPVDYIRAGNLCPLLKAYPKARFVLMHIAYPYSDELVSLAKHYPNVWVDLCWAWSIDPYSSRDFVRRFIHAVPANKMFAFGGDTTWPNASVAYAVMARRWLTSTLQAEVSERLLTERQAMELADRFMQTNQEECFDLAGTRAAIAERLAKV